MALGSTRRHRRSDATPGGAAPTQGRCADRTVAIRGVSEAAGRGALEGARAGETAHLRHPSLDERGASAVRDRIPGVLRRGTRPDAALWGPVSYHLKHTERAACATQGAPRSGVVTWQGRRLLREAWRHSAQAARRVQSRQRTTKICHVLAAHNEPLKSGERMGLSGDVCVEQECGESLTRGCGEGPEGPGAQAPWRSEWHSQSAEGGKEGAATSNRPAEIGVI